jgi:hypothetical protein
MVFAAFLSVWTLITMKKRWYRETVMLAVAGLTAITFAAPYLRSLNASKGTGGQLLQLTVRTFDLCEHEDPGARPAVADPGG